MSSRPSTGVAYCFDRFHCAHGPEHERIAAAVTLLSPSYHGSKCTGKAALRTTSLIHSC